MKIVKVRKPNKNSSKFLVSFLILAVIFYQVAIPLSFVRAEELLDSETPQTQQIEESPAPVAESEEVGDEENASQEENLESAPPEEPSEIVAEVSEDAQAASQETPDQLPAENLLIENNNDTEITNTDLAEAGTGNNVISDLPAEQAEDAATTEVIADEANRNLDENSEDKNKVEEDVASKEIQTGDALAVNDVVNEANTNIVGENHLLVTLNLGESYDENINLLEEFQTILKKIENNEGLTKEEAKIVEVVNTNRAEIENNVVSEADTGNNISEASGQADIETGDAAAVTNIVNLVNRNIVGNNWLFYVINVFGNWTGDLIVPGEDLLSISGTGQIQAEIINENSADIENNAESVANTGDNETSAQADISTGNALAETQVENIVNTNIARNNWFFLLVNNMGNWAGQVLGWDAGTNSYQEEYSYDFGTDGADENSLVNVIKIHNKNEAAVINDVSSYANTGNNSVSGSGRISTGNAIASTKILNFINTNIVGNNWIFGLVNIMGSWNGNLVFAYPDLAINIDDARENVISGEEIIYDVSYRNIGKADGSNISIELELPKEVAYLGSDSGLEHHSEGDKHIWNLESLKPAEEGHFKVMAKPLANSDFNPVSLNSIAVISTETKEKELGNNASQDATMLAFPEQGNSGDGSDDSIESDISVKRTESFPERFFHGDMINYSIEIENKSDDVIRDLVLEDRMRNGAGTVNTYAWEIGSLGKNEKVRIDYSVQISDRAPAGDYRNKAVAIGRDELGNKVEDQAISEYKIAPAVLGWNNFENLEEGDDSFAEGSSELAGQEIKSESDFIRYMAMLAFLALVVLLAYLRMISKEEEDRSFDRTK